MGRAARNDEFLTKGAILWAAALLLFGGCKGEPETAPDPDPGGGETVAEAGTAAPAVDGGRDLTPFDATAQRLDFGGEVFVYQDVGGQAAKAAEFLNALMAMVPEGEPGWGPARKIDWAGVFDDLGATNVAAAGASSHQVGGRYLNKVYIHIPGGRRGVLRLFGRGAGAFETRAIAPAGADLVIERELNLTEAYRFARDMIKRFEQPEAERDWKQLMGQKIADAGVTVGDLFQKLDTRLMVVARLSEERTIALPGAPAELPQPEFYLALDGMGWLFEKLLEQLPPEAADAVEEGEGFKLLRLPPMPPEAPFLQPVVRVDTEGGRVALASSPAFLEECGSGEGGLFDSPEFKGATAGLPAEGNGLTYISADVGKHLERLLEAGLDGGGRAPAGFVGGVTDLLARAFPQMRGSYARVSANLPDGILTVANSPASLKHSVVLAPMAVAAVGWFSYSNAKGEAPIGADPDLPEPLAGEGADGEIPVPRRKVAFVPLEDGVGRRGVPDKRRPVPDGPPDVVRVYADFQVLETALLNYKIEAGVFPSTGQGLDALIGRPDGVAVDRWSGPYMRGAILDPWGNEYGYRFPPAQNPDRSFPELFSKGADGQGGTADDIGNW